MGFRRALGTQLAILSAKRHFEETFRLYFQLGFGKEGTHVTTIIAIIGLVLNVWGFTSIARISGIAANSYKHRADLLKMTVSKIQAELDSDDGVPLSQKKRWIKEYENLWEDAIKRERDYRERSQFLSSLFNRASFYSASFVFLAGTAAYILATFGYVASYQEQRADGNQEMIFWGFVLFLIGSSVAFVLLMLVALVIRRTLGMSGTNIGIRAFTCWLLLYASTAFLLVFAPIYYLYTQGILLGVEAFLLTLILSIAVYLGFFPSFTMTCLALCDGTKSRFEIGELIRAFLGRRMPMPKELTGI